MNHPVPLPLEAPDTSFLTSGGAFVRRSVLPSGVRVLTEAMPGASSTSLGFWVGVGSRDERAGQYGSTHFRYTEAITLAGLIFLAASYPTSLLIRKLEKKLA